MGSGRTTSDDVRVYYSSSRPDIKTARSASEVFKQRNTFEAFRPSNLKNGIRESCDSASNPNSYAIIIGFDETGSMGEVPFEFIKNGFPRFIKMIQNGALGYDPHLLFAAIGDVRNEEDGPLQVTQFEADTRMLDQLSKLYLEGGGGGNNGESYNLPWYFAAKHTSIDCYSKRGKKGTIITIGDDKPHPYISGSEIAEVFGRNELEGGKISSEECLRLASERYNIYHIRVLGEASTGVDHMWKMLLGKCTCRLSNYKYVAELIACILKCQEGMSKEEAIMGIENREAKVCVQEALMELEIKPTTSASPDSATSGIQFV